MVTELRARAGSLIIRIACALVAALAFTLTALAAQSSPSITVTPAAIGPDETVTVTIANGPGSPTDWVALYVAGAPNPAYLDWKYLNGSKTAPAAGVTGATLTFTLPTNPGVYDLRFYGENGFTLLGSATATVVPDDTTPPAVALTAPAAGITVSGVTTVSATASDDVGVAGVQFQLDGVALGAEDVTAPYSVSWTTATATNGPHTLTAVARDASSNQTVSAPRSVTVDTTPPVISAVAVSSITATGATFTWTTDEPSDTQVNYGLTTAYGTNTPMVAADVTSHSVVRSGLTPNTTYHFRVRSRDAAVPGNLTLSGDFTFTTLSLSSNLVAAFAYDEGAGTTAEDGSVNNNTATVSGTSWSTACRFGTCLAFNGATSYVETPDADVLTPGVNATFEAWVVLTAAPSEIASVFNKWDQTVNDEYIFGIDTNRTLVFAWQTTAGSTWGTPSFSLANSTGTIPLNTLTHIALVRSGTTVTFYINGTPEAPRTAMDTNPFRNGINALRVGGQDRGAGRFFAGRIDEVRLYDKALTQAQVQLDMTTAIGVDVTAPVVSAIAASAITISGATIGWTTNEASDSQVDYGPTTAYGTTSPLNGSLVTAHTVTVGALTSSTTYHFRVRSKDAAGNLAVSGDFTFTTLIVDVTLPVVSVVAASSITASGATIGWTTNEATDTQVDYGPTTAYGASSVLNGTLVTAHTVLLSGLSSNSVYHYRVRSRDAAGNLALSGDFTFTTLDGTAPTVALTAPAANATVSGAITVSATASDSGGVTGVQFRLDGAPLGAEDVTAPFAVLWDTTTAANGVHTLTAVARDAATNQTTSAARTVTVANDLTPPVVSAVGASSITVAGATIAWTTNEASDSQVEYGVTTAYGSASALNASLVTSHSMGLSGLAANTTYHYRVRSEDAAGNLATSADFTFTTLAGGDVTPPTVSVSAPSPGATVSGTVTISATAADAVGVAGVQFRMDGAPLGAEDLAAPFTVPWDTTTAADGVHTLTAVARDAATNQTTSAARSVTVANLSSNLVAAFAYDEGAGTTAADGSGNNNTATVSGASWSTACRFGTCLAFNGTSSFVETPDADGLTPGVNATFEAWVVLTAAPSEIASVFNKWDQTVNDEYIFGIDTNRTLVFAWQTTAGSTWGTPSFSLANSTGTIPLNTLTHIALVRSGTTLTFYINGTPEAPRTAMDTNPFRNGINALRVGGQDRGAGRFFAGRIDEVRLYGQALTQADVQRDMATTIADDVTPPVVSAVAASALTASSATIGWTTNEASDSQVDYGPTTAYGTTSPLNGSLMTAHSVSVSALAANTTYHFRVRSKDAAGNLAVSGDFTFTTLFVDTTPPVISGVSVSAITSSGATFSWTTNEASDTEVEYGPTTTYGGFSTLNGTRVTAHTMNLSGLAAGTLHHYRVRSRDAAGNLGLSGDLTFTTLEGTPPTVAITAPAQGAMVSGTVTVTATASDNVGVVGVQFRVDGVALGAEDTVAPYAVSWNTSTASPGSPVVTAVARDAAGNQRTSSPVTVTVATADVTLAWNPNSESDLDGYKLHFGTAAGSYSVHVDVGNVTSYTVSGLQPGTAYYFAVTAYNVNGTESGASNEVSATR